MWNHYTNKNMKFFDKDIDAAIFDMDGTMFDTERLRFKMLKQSSLELFGQEMSDELLFDSLGVSAVTGEKLAKDVYGEEFPYKEIRAHADDLERQYVREHGVPVKEGLYNLLERLKKNQVLIALATSSRHEIAMEYVIRAKVLRYFDILVCGDEVEKGKPNPEIFQKAAAELCCDPEKCLIIEDSTNGLKAAIGAGGIPIYIKDIKDVDEDVLPGVYRSYTRMIDFRDDLVPFSKQLSSPDIFETFPQNTDYEVAGIHGFGAIGGGYLAQIFSHGDGYTRPHKLIGATRNPMIIQLVNSLGKYRVKYESIAYFQNIENIEVIDIMDDDQVIDMYEQSHIIGLSLPEKVIPSQSMVIAKALMNRYRKQKDKLTILVAMNKINASRYVKKHVEKALATIVEKEEAKAIIESAYFVETVVNRMVSATPEENIAGKIKNDIDILYHNVTEYYDDLHNMLEVFNQSDKVPKPRSKKAKIGVEQAKVVSVSSSINVAAQFIKDIDEINVTLFSAEPDMPLYASDISPDLVRFRQIVVMKDIKSMQEIKNKLSNGTHAIIAWYSWLLGYDTIGQGMGDLAVQKVAKKIMKQEIRTALIAENPELKSYIDSFISNFIKRCRVSFKDKCTRVGRDPLRKLQNGERVIGAISLVQKHGKEAPTLEFGVACAILYSLKSVNVKDSEAARIRELYEENNDIGDVLTYSGPYNKSTYKGLDAEKDADLIARIKKQFLLLQEKFSDIE